MPDSADRILREFRRYNGDGVNPPVLGELPIGDPRSGVNNPSLAEWRALFGLGEQMVDAAEAARLAAEAARDLAQDYAGAAVSQGNVPIYGSKAVIAAFSIPIGLTSFRLDGHATRGDGGGGFYVETVTETDATLGVIADAGSPKRYFKYTEPRVNVRAFGAKGDGVTDDRVAIQKAIDFACARGLPIWFPNWPGAATYLINSGLSVNDAVLFESAFDLIVINDAKIKAGAGIHSSVGDSGRVLRVQTTNSGPLLANEAKQSLRWIGGTVDTSSLVSSNIGVDTLSIGPQWGRVSVIDATFDHGIQAPSGQNIGNGGGDSSIFVKEYEHLLISGCQFLGARDSGIYLSGDPDSTRIAFGAAITGNRFRRCNNAISIKRKAQDTFIFGNRTLECGNGVNFGSTATGHDQGVRGAIVANTFLKCQGNPINIENSEHVTIIGNTVLDYRRWVSDPNVETVASDGGAVRMDGVRFSTIVGNTFGFDAWPKVTTSTRRTFGVVLRGYDNGTAVVKSEWNAIFGNVFRAPYAAILANANATNNHFGNNVVNAATADDIIQGKNIRSGRVVFSPNLAGSGSNLNAANYDKREGTITYDGDHVTVHVYLDISSASGLQGTVTISSAELPEASGPITRYSGSINCQNVTLSANFTMFNVEIESGAGENRLLLFESGSSVKQALTHANFNADSRVSVTITYRVG